MVSLSPTKWLGVKPGLKGIVVAVLAIAAISAVLAHKAGINIPIITQTSEKLLS